MGRPDGIEAILRDVIRPRAAYVAAAAGVLPAVEALYRVDPGAAMVRMWVDRAHFRPYPASVQRLLPVEIGELNRLYQLGFASWLPSTAIADGVYYGMRVNGSSSPRPGTHVVSPSGPAGGRRQRPDPRRLSWPRLRDRRHRRRDRGAAAVLRPGRAQRPVRQPARPQRLPTPRLRRARPLRGAPRPSPRLALARPRGAAAPPLRPQGDRPPDDRHQRPPGPRRHRPRPRGRRRPPHRVGRARDARPAPHPRALRARAAARRASASGRASTSRPRPPT